MINNKKEIKKLEKFSKKFAKKHCEKERVNLTALVGLDSRKIEPYENSDFSIVKVKCIASLKGSDVSQNEVTLFFFYKDKMGLKYIIEKFNAYDFVIRKMKDKNEFFIDELKGKNKTALFNNIIEEQTKDLCLKDDDTIFKFNIQDGWFDENVEIENKKAYVVLMIDDATSEACESLKTFKKFKKNFTNLYKKILTRCSKELVEIAEDWSEEEQPITAKDIQSRIDCESFDLTCDGTAFTIYLNDGGLFGGHAIVYYGDINDLADFEVDIVG